MSFLRYEVRMTYAYVSTQYAEYSSICICVHMYTYTRDSYVKLQLLSTTCIVLELKYGHGSGRVDVVVEYIIINLKWDHVVTTCVHLIHDRENLKMVDLIYSSLIFRTRMPCICKRTVRRYTGI